MAQTILAAMIERYQDLGPWDDPAGVFAQIFVADGVTAQGIANGAGYTKLTAFNTAQGANGQANVLKPDKANSKITIPLGGRYLVNFSISASFATLNLVRITAFLNGVEQSQIHSAAKVPVADRWAQASHGIIRVTAVPWDLDLRCNHDNAGPQNLTPVFISLDLHRIGN